MAIQTIDKNDSFLWDQLRTGNEAAFRTIYSNHIHTLYSYGLKFTADENLVKDCIQDVFINIFRNRKNLGRTDNIKLYLFVSLKRSIFRTLSTQSRLRTLNFADLPFLCDTITDQPNANNEVQADRLYKVQLAMHELPERQREVLYLHFAEELSYDEIQQVMDINYQSVRNLMSRAIKKLRALLIPCSPVCHNLDTSEFSTEIAVLLKPSKE